MKPIVHIGPPKTGSTSIQETLLPKLGRPLEDRPQWTRDLTRSEVFQPPRHLTNDVIVSDEALGEFARIRPEAVLKRLRQVFTDAIIVIVIRPTADLFLSYYKQQVVNSVPYVHSSLKDGKATIFPRTANDFFDFHKKNYEQHGIGFFAMTNFPQTISVFQQAYKVVTLPFRLLIDDPSEFSKQFAQACGSTETVAVQHLNKTVDDKLEDALQKVADTLPAKYVRSLTYLYNSPELSEDRHRFLQTWGAAS